MQDPPLLRNIPPRSQHNFITFHWSVCLWFYITEPTLQNNFQSKVIHFVLKSSIFVNDGKSQKHNGISWFSKIAIFKKKCHEPNEYRWYQRFLVACVSISAHCPLKSRGQIFCNIEWQTTKWSFLSAIRVCMIASIDHLDVLRVTNGASYPLSGWLFVGSHL